jgi:ABC transport system ATP-binding/permease protein
VATLLNAQGLSKTYGATPLFQNVSLNIAEGDRVGVVGPNGAGKSTLLQILAGRVEPDDGQVARRKNTRLAYVPQESQFAPADTVRSVIHRAFVNAGTPESERQGREAELLGRLGFQDVEAEALSLSGGWRKRLSIAEALVIDPDILLLDEPTNHLDLGGIVWLEKLLQGASFATVVISHDRYFLENVATTMVELDRSYPDGLFRVAGNYTSFLEKKSEFLAAQSKHQEALENRVKTEIEWLRRGPKARATKAKARIDKANELIGELSDLNARTRTATADIDFSATDRKTKRLAEFENVTYGYYGRTLFQNLNLVMTGGTRVGLVGPNGSGKTTLLRLLRGELEPQSGTVKRADGLRIVYFDQNRPLDPSLTLRRALAPDSDSVVYQDRTIHVASWAARFLFSNDQLNQPVSRLSGGERARVLIARLMLEPADLLLMDEPTNDLDIPTLEILEESLTQFPGALVLVTHDRFMLDRVSTLVLGLSGNGDVERFADYSQWERWQTENKQRRDAEDRPEKASSPEPARAATPPKKKLSYLDSRDMETIESRISEAEETLASKRALIEDQAVARDPKRLQEALRGVEEALAAVDKLYERWAELEAKIS